MATQFQKISTRIDSMKSMYESFRKKQDDVVFSGLCIKYSIYKNPALELREADIQDAIIDGAWDGGADFVILDPNNSEASDLIIGQAKYRERFSVEEAKNAINKMIDFFFKMNSYDFTGVRPDVVNRFQKLFAETGEESKFIFCLYVSAPKNSIKKSTLNKVLSDRLGNEEKYELKVFFGADIENEIDEAESRQPCVEEGTLELDRPGNVLKYGEDSAIVNISAKSLKLLYSIHLTNLLSMNLRYFTKKKDLDSDIKGTIVNNPESFWFKNNGITIVCDEFEIDSRKLKLKHFSIVNGGQTTHLIYNSSSINDNNDFYIACKVITAQGDTQEEKDEFILGIATATNSQKPIKDTDLKANAPEQIQFGRAMKDRGIFYKTKRGENIPAPYKEYDYQHADYPSVGKLYLAGIYQLPGKSRNKPSTMKEEKYYNPVFNQRSKKVCGIIKDLLYVDFYFRNTFIKEYDKEHEGLPQVPFANNSRTVCISFIGLAARLAQNNICEKDFVKLIIKDVNFSYYEEYIYPCLKTFEDMEYLINPETFRNNKESVDRVLYEMFCQIIKEGYKLFNFVKTYDPSMSESNYLKPDGSYYKILSASWIDLYDEIKKHSDVFR